MPCFSLTAAHVYVASVLCGQMLAVEGLSWWRVGEGLTGRSRWVFFRRHLGGTLLRFLPGRSLRQFSDAINDFGTRPIVSWGLVV